MALYIDSADTVRISALWSSGVFAGVTTNPTIVARAGLTSADLGDLHRSLRELGVERIFMQVDARSDSLMHSSATDLRVLERVVVKVPATRSGIALAGQLARDGVEVLLTAVYDPVQAMIGRDLGLQWIAPYVGRITDNGGSGVGAVTAMQAMLASSGTRILAASLRSVDNITDLALAGVADFTVGVPLARSILDNDLTDRAVGEFNSAE